MTPRNRAFFLASFGALASCSRHSAAPDAAPTIAERVVSLSPSTTETMFAIHAQDRLVGRSRYCDYPPEATNLPEVGGYTDPNFEAIVGLRPDLVVGARGPAGPQLEERLGGFGAKTFFPETESLAQIDTMVGGLGDRTGHANDARALVDAMHARENAVAKAIAGLPKVRVLLIYGLTPTVSAGPGSFADEILTRAGAINVVTGGGAYPMLGMEQIIALDPDLVLGTSMEGSRSAELIAKDAPGWKSVRAVQTDHVVVLTDESVLRPGPRVGEAIATVARAIHPGLVLP